MYFMLNGLKVLIHTNEKYYYEKKIPFTHQNFLKLAFPTLIKNYLDYKKENKKAPKIIKSSNK